MDTSKSRDLQPDSAPVFDSLETDESTEQTVLQFDDSRTNLVIKSIEGGTSINDAVQSDVNADQPSRDIVVRVINDNSLEANQPIRSIVIKSTDTQTNTAVTSSNDTVQNFLEVEGASRSILVRPVIIENTSTNGDKSVLALSSDRISKCLKSRKIPGVLGVSSDLRACPHCFELIEPGACVSHLRNKHPSKPSFICYSCKVMFSNRVIFEHHLKNFQEHKGLDNACSDVSGDSYAEWKF